MKYVANSERIDQNGGTLRSRLARSYFALQAVAVLAWWIVLWLRPEWRAAFRPFSAPDAVLHSFAPGDLLMLGVGSALIASDHHRRHRRLLAWLVAGATVYAALYTLTLALAGAAPPLGALLMCPAAIASGLAAFSLDDQVSSIPSSGAR
jgi:hypothetical protein